MLPLLLADAAAAVDPGSLFNQPGFIALAGMLIIGVVAVHHSLQIGSKLRADAAKREADAAAAGKPAPIEAKLERIGATVDDLVDTFLEANKSDEKALADPNVRAAALEHLRAAGVKAIEDRIAAPSPVAEVAKAAPLVLALLSVALALPSCAAHVEPMLVTRDAITATDKTFLATQIIMDGLKPQLTAQVWQSWVLFEMRFGTSFHAARVLYDDAEKAAEFAAQNDGGTDAIAQADLKAAQQVVDSFVAQLGYWQGVAAQLSHPDGGSP